MIYKIINMIIKYKKKTRKWNLTYTKIVYLPVVAMSTRYCWGPHCTSSYCPFQGKLPHPQSL